MKIQLPRWYIRVIELGMMLNLSDVIYQIYLQHQIAALTESAHLKPVHFNGVGSALGTFALIGLLRSIATPSPSPSSKQAARKKLL